MLKEMFSRLTPNSERALAERVQKEGGIDTVQNNDQLLRTLLQTSPANAQERGVSSAPSRGGQKNAPKRSTKPRETYTLSDLKEELRENQDDALKNHLNAFERRFEMHQRQFKEEIERLVRDGNDRVIDAVTRGPHDLINHPVNPSHAATLYALTSRHNRTC